MIDINSSDSVTGDNPETSRDKAQLAAELRSITREPEQNPNDPVNVESWAETPPWKDLPDIPQLQVDLGRYRYCSQGRATIIEPDEESQVGSDGFSKCSGVIIQDRTDGRVMVAHVDPGEDTFYDQLKDFGNRQNDITVIQGDQSVHVAALEEASIKQSDKRFLKNIHVASGQQSFGILYDHKTKQLRIFSRSPEQLVTTYQL